MIAAAPSKSSQKIAAVVIGRNEEARLQRCLESLGDDLAVVVYVDSASVDASAILAAGMGVKVVQLDARRPLSAARARNAGFDYVRAQAADVDFVQFVDGDCIVESGWIAAAAAFLQVHPDVAVAFGRRREQFPDQSIYNRLCDVEWRVPPGQARSCGGDAMIRADALALVGGYRDDVIAGEEPELCVRLRQEGWKIFSLDDPMTLHDARMYHFSQWWKRAVRCGYAYAQGASLHGSPPERHWVREKWRAWIWGALIPVGIFTAALLLGWPALLLVLVYPAQALRLYTRRKGTMPAALITSLFDVIGKFPEALGEARFSIDQVVRRRSALIEYKTAR
jgi:glycosyltransferase involved in cell wall biosynthesis